MSEFKSVYQKTIEAVKSGDKMIYFSAAKNLNPRTGSPAEEVWETIIEFVAENSKNFKADIAQKILKGIPASDKQAWCIAYEVVALAEKIENWVELKKQNVA